MSKPPRYASTTKGREAAAAEIERMVRDIATTGRYVFAIHPRRMGGLLEIVVITAEGELISHTAPTLNEAYLAAMHWPATPPPF
jgi:hypothetical protein